MALVAIRVGISCISAGLRTVTWGNSPLLARGHPPRAPELATMVKPAILSLALSAAGVITYRGPLPLVTPRHKKSTVPVVLTVELLFTVTMALGPPLKT